jgi:hypothetical protein
MYLSPHTPHIPLHVPLSDHPVPTFPVIPPPPPSQHVECVRLLQEDSL